MALINGILLFTFITVSTCHKPCIVYDADTGKIVTNYTSVARLRVDCSNRGLQKVPKSLPKRTYILDLHGNNISSIPDFIFQPYVNLTYLYLSDNFISKLNNDSFQGLWKLETLTLSGNDLCLPTGYPDGVFSDLLSLRVLKTYQNYCHKRHKSIPDQAFKGLVSLEKLSLDVADKLSFGDGFKELTNLTHLEVSSYNNCDTYHITIQNNSFDGLTNSNLTHLTLRGCAYRDVANGAFTKLTNLNTLNTACARNLDTYSFFQAIYNMKEPTLETLIMDGMVALGQSSCLTGISDALTTFDTESAFRFFKRYFTAAPKNRSVSPFCHPKLQNLKKLSIRANHVENFNLQKGNGESCLPHLHHINIGMNYIFDLIKYTENDFARAQDILRRGFPTKYFWSLNNIRTVDASKLFWDTFSGYTNNWFCTGRDLDEEDFFRQPPELIQEIPDLEDNFNISDGRVKSDGSINVTDIDSFKGVVHAVSSSPGTQVFYFDSAIPSKMIDPTTENICPYVFYPYDTIAYYNVSYIPIEVLTCPLYGLKSLRVMDASFCDITYFHRQDYLTNLTWLYLRGNKLNNTDTFPEILGSFHNLKELDLGHNGIHFLPENSFENLISLERLDLSGNVLTSVNLSLTTLTKLKNLDLSRNMLPYLEESFLNQVEQVFGLNPKFTLWLTGNPFTCGCDSIHFLNWLKATNVTIGNLSGKTCPNSTTLLTEVDTEHLEHNCVMSYLRYYVIIVSLAVSMLLVLASSVVAYRKRWKIAWHVYTIKRKLFRNNYEKLDEDSDDKIYKAFVAYHIDHEIGNDNGIAWISGSLCHYVEKEWGQKLFIFDRNAELGGSKIGETILGIQQSEKVVFVITATYLKRGNWEMILYWAVQQGLINIIICCLEDIDIDKLPVPLAKVAIELQEKYPTNYLEIRPETCDGPSDIDMWNNFRIALDCDDIDE